MDLVAAAPAPSPAPVVPDEPKDLPAEPVVGGIRQIGGAPSDIIALLFELNNTYAPLNYNINDFLIPTNDTIDAYTKLAEITVYINLVNVKFAHLYKNFENCLDFKPLENILSDFTRKVPPFTRAMRAMNQQLYLNLQTIKQRLNDINSRMVTNLETYRSRCIELIKTMNYKNSDDDTFIGILPSFTLPDINDDKTLSYLYKITPDEGNKNFVTYTVPSVEDIGRELPAGPNTAKGNLQINQRYYYDFAMIIPPGTARPVPPARGDTVLTNNNGSIGTYNGPDKENILYSKYLYNPDINYIMKKRTLDTINNTIIPADRDTIKQNIKKHISDLPDTLRDQIVEKKIAEAITYLIEKQIEYYADVKAREIVNDVVSNTPYQRLPATTSLITDSPLDADRYINFSELNSDLYKDLIGAKYAFLDIKHELPIMKPSHVSLINDNKKDRNINIFYDTNYFQEYSNKLDCYNNKSVEVLRALKKPNISYNIQDIKGKTPLFYAIGGYNVDIIDELLDKQRDRLLSSKDKSGLTPLDVVINKEKYHLSYLLDDSDKLVFGKKYWDMLQTELEEHNHIKNNIPFYLENIFDIAIYIQNYYWKNGLHRVSIPEIVQQSDIDAIVANLTAVKDQYRQMHDSDYATKNCNFATSQNIEIDKEFIERDTLAKDIESKKLTISRAYKTTINTGTKNAMKDPIPQDELYFQDIIIMQLRKVAEMFNNKYHAGYSVFWDNVLKSEKQQYLIHIDTSIREKELLSPNTALTEFQKFKSILSPIVTFIEFQYIKDKSLEGNVYYGYLTRLYTHILGQILGANMYNAIKRLVFNEVLSKISQSGDTKAANISQTINTVLSELKEFIVSDKLNDKNMNFLYVLKALNREELSKFEEVNRLKSEDEIFDMVTRRLEKLSPSLNITETFKDNLLPYYRVLYSSVFKHLNNMMRNYHKFILNQHRGLTVLEKLV